MKKERLFISFSIFILFLLICSGFTLNRNNIEIENNKENFVFQKAIKFGLEKEFNKLDVRNLGEDDTSNINAPFSEEISPTDIEVVNDSTSQTTVGYEGNDFKINSLYIKVNEESEYTQVTQPSEPSSNSPITASASYLNGTSIQLLIVVDNPRLGYDNVPLTGGPNTTGFYIGLDTGVKTTFAKIENTNFWVATATYTVNENSELKFAYLPSNGRWINPWIQISIQATQGTILVKDNNGEWTPQSHYEQKVSYIPNGYVELMIEVPGEPYNDNGIILDGYEGSGFYYNGMGLNTNWIQKSNSINWIATTSYPLNQGPQTIGFQYKSNDGTLYRNYGVINIEIVLPDDLISGTEDTNILQIWNGVEYTDTTTIATNQPISLIFVTQNDNISETDFTIDPSSNYQLSQITKLHLSDQWLYEYQFSASEVENYSISIGENPKKSVNITVVEGAIRVNNITLGTVAPFNDVDVNTATMMVNSANKSGTVTEPTDTVNSPIQPYIIYVGDTLNLSLANKNAKELVSNNQTILESIQDSSYDFLALSPGNTSISAKDSDKNIIQTFYIQVQYPINVGTGENQSNFINKNFTHEYVETAGTSGYPYSEFIFNNEGNPLYFKNNETTAGIAISYLLITNDSIKLQGIKPINSNANFAIRSGNANLIETETSTLDGKFQSVEVSYKVLQPGNIIINFGDDSNYQSFYITVYNDDQYANHYDIEVNDGIQYSVTNTTLVSSSTSSKKETVEENYKATIAEVHGSKVYTANNTLATSLAWWQYWHRYNSYAEEDIPKDAQDEFTSAYYTYPFMEEVILDKSGWLDKILADTGDQNDVEQFKSQYPKVRWLISDPGVSGAQTANSLEGAQAAYEFNQKVVTTDTIFPNYIINPAYSSNAIEFWKNRNQVIGNIENVTFDVDVLLSDPEADSTPSVENGILIQDLSLPMTGQTIIDAWNKCPNHGGLDFVTPITAKLVKVTLVGSKNIIGRDWDNTIDNGAYSFTLTANNNSSDKAPISSTETVTNVGQTITFPEIVFSAPGTYFYTISEDQVGPKIPDDVETDTNIITVTIEIPESMDDANITYKNANGDQINTNGIFTFTNIYTKEDETGNLIVTKQVSDGVNSNEVFDFIATFSDKDNNLLNGNVTYTKSGSTTPVTAPLQKGQVSFTLSPNQNITFIDLPVGTNYTIEEINNDEYLASWKNEKGTISTTNSTCTVLNTLKEEDTGTLTLTKKAPEASTTESFNFSITFKDSTGTALTGSVKYSLGNSATTSNMNLKNGQVDFNLSPNDSISFFDLEYGTTYSIEETEVTGYTPTWSNKTGIISNTNQNVSVTCTNNKNSSPTPPPTPTPTPSQNDLSIKKYQGIGNNQKTTQNINFVSGDIITYYLDIKNNSTSTQTNIKVTDTIPNGLILLSESITGEGATVNSSKNQITWNISQIKAGETITLTFNVKVPDNITTKTYYRNIGYLNNSIASNLVTAENIINSNNGTNNPQNNNQNGTITQGTTNNQGTTTNKVVTNTTSNTSPKTGVENNNLILLNILIIVAILVLIGSVFYFKRKSN